MQQRINNAIASLCVDIENEFANKTYVDLKEEDILFELVLSILGSQNKYEVALKFTEEIQKHNLLKLINTEFEMKKVQNKIENILISSVCVEDKSIRYRFPKSRAEYIAYNLWFLNSINGMKYFLENETSYLEVRKFFVKNIKGIGPKQASHFLRNIGFSNNIAILDVHVLRYMQIQGLIDESIKTISSLNMYEKIENLLKNFLKYLSYPIGLIDQAIWVVMRVYQREFSKWQ